MTTNESLDVLLVHLGALTPQAQVLWEAAERRRAEEDDDEPDTDHTLWFSLEYNPPRWKAGFRVRDDEATVWAGRWSPEQLMMRAGPTPAVAAAALLAFLEDAHA